MIIAFLDRAKRAEQAAIMHMYAAMLRDSQEKELQQTVEHLEREPEYGAMAHVVRTMRKRIMRGDGDPLLHDLALATFVGTSLFPILEQAVEWLPQPEKVIDLFGSLREQVLKNEPDLSGKTFFYYLKTLRYTWSALTSVLHRIPFISYDPKAFGYNASGLLFSEDNLDWTVGPTPTVGNHLAPEARAAIEGLGKSKKFSYSIWIYINLQSIQHETEKKRSKALWEAANEYPDRFRLASLSVDAPFYRGHSSFTSVHKCRDHMLDQLSAAVYEPYGKSWYAFSLFDHERDRWMACAEAVLEQTLEMAVDIQTFNELVVMGLARAWQKFTLQGKAISTIACKECIDRAGSLNAAFFWALCCRQCSEQEKAKKCMAILWGRPLLARSRLVEPSRTQGFESLLKAYSSDDVNEYLKKVQKQVVSVE